MALEETVGPNGAPPDCVSFEALNWGFLHIRYHEAVRRMAKKCLMSLYIISALIVIVRIASKRLRLLRLPHPIDECEAG